MGESWVGPDGGGGGHSSLATTSCYLAHIAPAELVKAMQARTWSL